MIRQTIFIDPKNKIELFYSRYIKLFSLCIETCSFEVTSYIKEPSLHNVAPIAVNTHANKTQATEHIKTKLTVAIISTI